MTAQNRGGHKPGPLAPEGSRMGATASAMRQLEAIQRMEGVRHG